MISFNKDNFFTDGKGAQVSMPSVFVWTSVKDLVLRWRRVKVLKSEIHSDITRDVFSHSE